MCLVLGGVMLAGCRDDTGRRPATGAPQSEARLTVNNFRQVQKDMTLSDVQAILGPGEQVSPVTTDDDDVMVTYRWTEGDRNVVIMFENGRAEQISKSGF